MITISLGLWFGSGAILFVSLLTNLLLTFRLLSQKYPHLFYEEEEK